MRVPLRPLLSAIAAIAILGVFAGSAAAAPANDNFADAQQLSGNRGSVDFDLTDATNELSEPLVGGATDRTVWFGYTPSADGVASFSTCRSEAVVALDGGSIAVYTGAALAPLSLSAQSTGNCRNGWVNAAIWSLAVQAGHTYWVQIESSDASMITGGLLNYDFNSAAPANDDFTSAQALSPALPQTFDADNGLASIEDDEPGIEDWGPRGSLWYSWTPAVDGNVSIGTCGSVWSGAEHEIDSRVDVYTSHDDPADLVGLDSAAASDDDCPAPHTTLSHVYLNVSAGVTYFIRLTNNTDQFGYAYKLNLHWTGAPETAVPPYIYPDADALQVGETYSADYHDWGAYPAVDSIDIQWNRCDAAGNNCQPIAGQTGVHYVVDAADIGHRLSVSVTAHNSIGDTTADSAATALVAAPPSTGGGDPPPVGSSPPDPFPAPTIPSSLGKIKISSKKTITLPKLNIVCGAAASGPCTGFLILATAKVKKHGKIIKPVKMTFFLTVPPGSKMRTKWPLSSAALKAVKSAKSLKAAITIQLGAPDFSTKTMNTSATLAAK